MLKLRYKGKKAPTHSEVTKMTEKIASTLFEDVINEKDIAEIVEMYEVNIGIKAYDPDSLIY